MYPHCSWKFLSTKTILIPAMGLVLILMVVLWTASPVMAHDDEHVEASRTEKVVSWAGLIIVSGVLVARFTVFNKTDDLDDKGSNPEQDG